MKKTRLIYLFLLAAQLICAASFGKGRVDEKEKATRTEKLTADGPYILRQADGSTRIIAVNPAGNIEDSVFKLLPEDFTFKVCSHDKKHSFHVTLHPIERPAWCHNQPEKTFVMSDPHGNLDCVISLLQGNGIIDDNYHWQYKNNRLVVIGDVFDRGKDVVQIFWLLYQLEKEAEEAGGHLDFILGNHEPMVLMNDLRYTENKYKLLADTLNMKYPELFAPNTELGKWLCTRNTMQTVGRNLFVHAGLSKEFFEKGLTIPTVNEQMSLGLYKKKAERKEASPLIYFLFGSKGPIWYRGMVKKEEKYNPLSADTLQLILEKYDVDRIIVGHTIFKDISTFYNKKVIAVNVDNPINRKKKRGRAILITRNCIFVVGDKGIIREITR